MQLGIFRLNPTKIHSHINIFQISTSDCIIHYLFKKLPVAFNFMTTANYLGKRTKTRSYIKINRMN